MSKSVILTLVVFLFCGCSEKSVPTSKSVSVETNQVSASEEKPKEEQGGAKKLAPIEEELPVFQTFGEAAPVGFLDRADPITEKYGFRLERVASCEVGTVEASLAVRNNKASMKKMVEKYGKDWQKKFTEETKLMLAIPF